MRRVPSLEELDAEKTRRSLTRFIREAWDIVEPARPLEWNWHIEVIATHVSDLLRGRLGGNNLVINVPPGTMKSLIVSVFAPTWWWLSVPSWRAIFISGNPRVSMRDSVKRREILESPWYRQQLELLCDGDLPWEFAEDQNAKGLYKNSSSGFMQAASTGAKLIGDRADAVMVDDPLDPNDAQSETIRESVLTWWDQTASRRVTDPRSSIRCIIMQRVHENDPSGHVLKTGDWKLLCLPMEYEPNERSTTGFKDPRTKEGELLFPQRFTPELIAADKKVLGSAGTAGQLQQNPSPASGLMFDPGWWRFWRHAWEPEDPRLADRTVVLPEAFDDYLQSWDMAFKGSEGSDLVAGGLWAKAGGQKFLMDITWRELTFVLTLAAVREMSQRHPEAELKLIENTANGPAVINTLETEISGIVPVTPQGDKPSRAAATSPQVEAGNIFLPLHAEWRDRYIEEFRQFPKGAHDDAVDQQSQALLRWQRPDVYIR